MKIMERKEVYMKTVDLFAGCGGLSIGFEKAGFDLVAAFEYWKPAAQCYRDNFDHPVFETDLSEIDKAVEEVSGFSPELIIGGPPCQDFSHAGKRIESDRANLTKAFAEIISSVKPKYFVMENVDRAKKSNAYHEAREIFVKNGYGLTEIILDASHCGVPQKRKRFFCIGILDGEDDALREFIEKGITKKETTLRDYFGDSLGFEYYYRHPRNYSRRAVFSIDEPAPTMRGVNRPVPKGYPGHPNDACQINDSVRALTTEERALIQTFPKDYAWSGTKTDREQMIGNAVPVKLGEFVANALLRYIDNPDSEPNQISFKKWLVDSEGYSERAARDVVSRVKRANKIHPITDISVSYYLCDLDQTVEFDHLSVNVKSQIRRAMKLYSTFLLEHDQRLKPIE